jgi:tryptophanyl-tRNA synthetase
MGELKRMTQFKEKTQQSSTFEEELVEETVRELSQNPGAGLGGLREAIGEKIAEGFAQLFLMKLSQSKAERASVGLFTYPVLMAADILLYQTDLVPVGKDQKQHLELCRDLAERFNRDYGETFKIPDPFIPPVGASIKSLQDPSKKMSKSDENPNGSIFLLDDADTITKKIKRAVTDSGTEITFDETRPAITNLLTIYQLITDKSSDDCVAHFAGKGYGQFKTELADATVEFLKPFQERIKQFDDETLKSTLSNGAERARTIAAKTLSDVYEKTGISYA